MTRLPRHFDALRGTRVTLMAMSGAQDAIQHLFLYFWGIAMAIMPFAMLSCFFTWSTWSRRRHLFFWYTFFSFITNDAQLLMTQRLQYIEMFNRSRCIFWACWMMALLPCGCAACALCLPKRAPRYAHWAHLEHSKNDWRCLSTFFHATQQYGNLFLSSWYPGIC